MSEKTIVLGGFEFPRLFGLEYLFDNKGPVTDYLFINCRRDGFSMYFEENFPAFTLPEQGDRQYSLLEIKRRDRTIRVYCPEGHKKLDSVVWYFCVELLDKKGVIYPLAGQVRVGLGEPFIGVSKAKPKILGILEQVRLKNASESA